RLDRAILTDVRVRTAAGVDTADAFRRQRTAASQEFGILARVDVVCDRDQFELAAHPLAQPVHQRRFAGADRAADADPQRVFRRCAAHERNSREYCVSCAIEARSTAKVALPKSAGSRLFAAAAAEAMSGSSPARIRCPSVWPISPRRNPADIRFDAKACR